MQSKKEWKIPNFLSIFVCFGRHESKPFCKPTMVKCHFYLPVENIGPQCVQNRRSVGSSRKESKRGVRDCTFDNIQASATASCNKSAVTL